MKGNILLMVILVLLVATACGGASPVQPEPESTATPLLLADFAACSGTNNLGGAVGAAYTPPDLLQETYVKAEDGGCHVLMDYKIDQWAALYLLLPEADLTPYRQLVFDIKAVPQPGMRQPNIRFEFKKANGEVSTVDVNNLSPEWQTRTVRLSEFGRGYGKPIRSWKDISEFVVVMEQAKSGREGTILLDNLILK